MPTPLPYGLKNKLAVCDQELLARGVETLAIDLSFELQDKLLIYCRELQKWNKRINLIARNTPAAEIIEKHFLDSLTLLPCIAELAASSPSLLDVGTGAGFPGLVLAAAMPELTVTLVEPRQKRVSFLRHIIRTLQLTNVRVIARRLEQAELRNQNFSCITSRAVADIDGFLALIKGTAGPKSVVITMQAVDNSDLWEINRLGKDWQLLEKREVQLPFSGAQRVLSLIRKKD